MAIFKDMVIEVVREGGWGMYSMRLGVGTQVSVMRGPLHLW